MKIVFMGTPEFAWAILEKLTESDHEVLAVVTGPDKPAGRRRALTPTVVRKLAEKHELPVLMPKSLKDESLHQSLAALKADLFVVAAFRILPPRLFELPRLGAINIHASLLPRYRGAAPINWAIINGETETGLTSFFLKQKVDTGDMILQTKVTIAPTDTYDSLHDRLADLAGPFTLETLSMIEQGKSRPRAQDDAVATPAPKIRPEDALIDFNQPGVRVANFVRGMATKPGAYTFFRGQKLKVHFAQPSDHVSGYDAAPGNILSNKKALLVQCHDSVVELTRVVPAGRKEMDGVSFLNGFRPQAGESFVNQGKAE
jgi:methionyl-tRNA formyltransferase